MDEEFAVVPFIADLQFAADESGGLAEIGLVEHRRIADAGFGGQEMEALLLDVRKKG